MENEVTKLVGDIKKVISGIIEEDVSVIKGFSERQVKAMAEQTLKIQKGVLNGNIDEDLKNFFIEDLKRIALNFVNTLQGLIALTIEKIWNGIITFLTGLIPKVI